jgi:5-methylcytosine-specific restriction protein A
MQLIQNVLAHYIQSFAAKVAGKTGSIDQQAILVDLPIFFRQVVTQKRKLTDFKIEGSIGNGNIAYVPWVGVFHRSITASAQNGFYIVLLFAQDMQSCTLSLNQGVTDIIQRYPQKMAKIKVREYAARAAQCFPPAPGAILGPIDLAAKGNLGKGYEAAAIESFRYEANALPSAQIVAQHLEQLLEHYERLIQVAGTSLESLVPITEQEYQQSAQEAAVPSSQEAPMPPQDIPKDKPAPIQTPVGKTYPRDPKVAGEALAAAQYRCEVDSQHPTFTSYAKKRPYIEAHHLVPLALQDQFPKSLDVVANVVGLCPHCHKLLHLGQPQDKKPLLFKLFNERSQRLAKVGISMDRAALLQHYKMELAEDIA